MNAEFVDTNILIYANDRGAGTRHRRSVELLEEIWDRRAGALSTQVLIEFYAAGTRKLGMTSLEAENTIRSLGTWFIHRPDHADLLDAIRLEHTHQLSWWDAMIVNSAMKAGARLLWTEDLNHGQRFGEVLVQNPFLQRFHH